MNTNNPNTEEKIVIGFIKNTSPDAEYNDYTDIGKSVFIKTADEKELLKKLKSEWKKKNKK